MAEEQMPGAVGVWARLAVGMQRSLQVDARLVVVAGLAEQVGPARLGQERPMSRRARSKSAGRPAGAGGVTGRWRRLVGAPVAAAPSPPAELR